MTGAATFLVGVLSTHAQIGTAAPLLLALLRAVQGIAVGGEWGGAVLMASENAPKGRGSLYAMLVQQGSPAGRSSPRWSSSPRAPWTTPRACPGTGACRSCCRSCSS
ncbi:hypothetical protein ACIRFH_25550 [Streptomyces sp. NPDC093586]|uniref:hypothetical protein n=1 Tax=Streptomyces sp. NPDC093586 TaxID=3366042 RepID=UPI0037F9B968